MKYIAKQVAPEWTDSDWDLFTDDDGRLWTVANYEHGRYHFAGKFPAIDRALGIVQNFSSHDESHMNSFLDWEIKQFYDDWGGICEVRGQKKPEWNNTRQAAKRAIRDYCNDKYNDELKTAVELLSAVSGIKYTMCDIRGCCQGDYAQLIIPSDECTNEAKDEIEARYFNTGTEWIIENERGECDAHAYTWAWRDEGREKQIREQCDISDAEELEIYEFDGWECTPKYKKAS